MPPEDVPALLAQATAAHLEYRAQRPHKQRNGTALITIPGDPIKAADALQRANDLRVQAELADPDGLSPAWTREHYPLLVFYAQQGAA